MTEDLMLLPERLVCGVDRMILFNQWKMLRADYLSALRIILIRAIPIICIIMFGVGIPNLRVVPMR